MSFGKLLGKQSSRLESRVNPRRSNNTEGELAISFISTIRSQHNQGGLGAVIFQRSVVDESRNVVSKDGGMLRSPCSLLVLLYVANVAHSKDIIVALKLQS